MATGATTLAPSAPLIGRLWPARAEGPAGLLRFAILAVLGTALLTLSAKVQVPFWPVPMTMQTFVVLVLGATYGWRLGGATVVLYLVEGAMGLPVFANTPPAVASLDYLRGPTGGFLIGFVAAAMLVGFLAERGWDRSLLRVTALMTVGHLVIFAFGLAWLSTMMPFAKAWMAGAAPFMAATVLKTALAIVTMQAAWGAVSGRRSA
jgi:biotin transport system substrate-specific component